MAAGWRGISTVSADAPRLTPCVRATPVGKEIVDEYIKYLSVGIVDMINIFQPDIFCIGGGICNEEKPCLPVREFVEKEQYAMNSSKKTVICRAELGNDAGIIGAALLGKQEE